MVNSKSKFQSKRGRKICKGKLHKSSKIKGKRETKARKNEKKGYARGKRQKKGARKQNPRIRVFEKLQKQIPVEKAVNIGYMPPEISIANLPIGLPKSICKRDNAFV